MDWEPVGHIEKIPTYEHLGETSFTTECKFTSYEYTAPKVEAFTRWPSNT
uniref:Inner membrane transport protein yjjL n=1 Tax=Rhizophora mucronata TaxID=61149 RepID=A0A2P2M7C3_RHIMU